MLLLRNSFLNFLYVFFLALLLTPLYVLSDENQSLGNSSIEVFVNASVADKKYTLADVRAIFAMRKTRWNDGKQIQVFVLSDTNPLHRQFTKSKLNMFPHQFRRIWDRLIFSGTGKAPKEVESIKEMQHMIAITPGAIGYLNTTDGNVDLRVLDYD